jgi:hypothetical protein
LKIECKELLEKAPEARDGKQKASKKERTGRFEGRRSERRKVEGKYKCKLAAKQERLERF